MPSRDWLLDPCKTPVTDPEGSAFLNSRAPQLLEWIDGDARRGGTARSGSGHHHSFLLIEKGYRELLRWDGTDGAA